MKKGSVKKTEKNQYLVKVAIIMYRERIIGIILSPLLGAVDIRFLRKAETIYQKDFSENQENRQVVENQVTVSTGSTMIFSFKGNEGENRAVIVRDYRGREKHDPGAKITEGHKEEGKVEEILLEKLNSRKPLVEIEGVGIFTWRK